MADDYEVGFGKPPKHTRFRKGQSGNLLGRPKGSTNVQAEMKRLLVAQDQDQGQWRRRDGADVEGPVPCPDFRKAHRPVTWAPSPRSSRSPAPRWPTNLEPWQLTSHPLTSISCVAPWPAKTKPIPAQPRPQLQINLRRPIE